MRATQKRAARPTGRATHHNRSTGNRGPVRRQRPGAALGAMECGEVAAAPPSVLEERERLAMDLHDGPVQALYGVMLQLGAIARTPDGATPETRREIERAVTAIGAIIEEIRASIAGLRPGDVDARGLPACLRSLASDLRKNAGIATTLVIEPGLDDRLPPDAIADLLQFAREAVSNVVRHARARSVTLALTRRNGAVLFSIRDDGQGFAADAAARRGGRGLHNMRARARRLGGILSIDSAAGQGTEIRLQLPDRFQA